MTAIIVWAIIATVIGAFLGAVGLLYVEEFHAERVANLRRMWEERG